MRFFFHTQYHFRDLLKLLCKGVTNSFATFEYNGIVRTKDVTPYRGRAFILPDLPLSALHAAVLAAVRTAALGGIAATGLRAAARGAAARLAVAAAWSVAATWGVATAVRVVLRVVDVAIVA